MQHSIAPRWDQIDGVRTPVVVCPNRKLFDKVVSEEAWHDEVKTTMIHSHRPVFACDDYNPVHFGGKLPRIAQARTPRSSSVYAGWRIHIPHIQPGCLALNKILR
jgi:hypothetical protein